MPTLNSSGQSVSLTSTIKTTFDADGNHQESKSSNTATDSRTFSVSIPSGAVVSACTFYFMQNSSSTYGGSAKVNSVERTSGSYSIALGAVTATTVSFSWKSRVTPLGSAPYVASYSQTISWTDCYIAVDYYYPYSACGAPTAVSTPSNVAPSTNYTLSWSGASSGTSNGISGYQVYRSTSPTTGYAALGGKVVTTAASGAMTVTSHATSGSIYYYKVATYGSVAGYDSGLSSAYATLKTLVTAPSAPTSISTPTDVAPGSTQSLTWSGASNGTNNAISKYHIYRSTDGGANYTYLAEDTTSPLSVAASPDNGGTYYYKIYTIGACGNSAISSVFATMKTTVGAPGVPTTVTVENGASVAPGKTRTLSWSGASAGTNNTIKGYHVYRSVNGGTYAYLADVLTTATSGSLVVDAASAAATYTYKVLVLGNTLSVNSALSSVYGTLKTETVPSTGTLTAASIAATGSNKIGITIVPQPETSYTHKVTWSIPNTSYSSGTISLLASDLYDEFTVPQAWILATTKDTTSVTAQCRIETFLETTSIGAHVYAFVVNVPPKSTITLSEGTVAANGTDKKTVTIAPTYSGYSHKVLWATAGYASAVVSIPSGTNLSDFAVPLAWNNSSPNDTSFLVTCTVETFKDTADGSLSLGMNVKTYTVSVPATIVPVITSFTATPVDAHWGLYVKTKSRCTLTPVVQGAYSSPIVSCQIVGATQNSGTLPYAPGTHWTTALLQVHGDPVTFTLSVTDGRQRTALATVNIAIADYASPSISGVTFSRAAWDADKAAYVPHNQGTFINAKATFTYSAIGDNAITAEAYYRQLGATNWLPILGADMFSNTILTYGDGAIAQGYLYDVKITLADYFASVEHTSMVAKAVKVWDIREDRASFGAFATNPKELYVPADWTMKVGTQTVLTDGDIIPVSRGGTGATTAAGALTKLGLIATAAELNYLDGVTSAVQTQLNGKAASSHGNHVPAVQTANNAIYLRNDNTWQTITAAEVGAAATSHNHSAADITSGTLTVARGGTGVTSAAAIALLSYPVGAVYTSKVSTSPATLFGGTWSAIAAGTFLVAAGTGYAAGGTGGAATHTHTTPNHAHTTPSKALTVANLPAHTHGIHTRRGAINYNYSSHTLGIGAEGTHAGIATVESPGMSGSAHAHGNTGNAAPTTNAASSLPPWKAFYMWERTA